MYPLYSPYHPLPEISDAEFQELYSLVESFCKGKISSQENKLLVSRLQSLGFLNESQWTDGAKLPKCTPTVDVSVYIPAYNAAHLLDETLSALTQQTYSPKEIIVVDDGSTDNTREVALKYTSKVITHKHNKGLSASRNTALEAVTSPLIAGIDADTVLDPFWIERLVPILEDPSCGGAAGRLIESYGITIADSWRKEFMGQHHGRIFKKNIHLFGCNSLMRTELLRKLGGFNPDCRVSFDDIDISERTIEAGYYTAYLPDVVCYHLKQDVPSSIVRSAYRWRVPPFEMKGSFQDPKMLAARWITEIKEGMKDINTVVAQKKGWLTFPCYMMILQTMLIDVMRIASANRKHPAVISTQTALEEAVNTQEFFSKGFKGEVCNRIEKTLANYNGDEFNVYPGSTFQNPPETWFHILKVILEDLPVIFRFSHEVSEQIEESLKYCQHDEVLDIHKVNPKAVGIVSPDAFLPMKAELARAANQWEEDKVAYRILFDSLDIWDTRATLTEVHRLSPDHVLWFATENEVSRARSATIILSLMLPNSRVETRLAA